MASPRPRTMFERITTWIGSPTSVVLHTAAFIGAFVIGILHVTTWELVLLVLTTVVSLEAIYLSIFIQMSVNRHAEELADVSEDVEDIQEDIDEIQEDVEEISEDIDEIQEDVEEISEEDASEEEAENERARQHAVTLEQLTVDVRRVLADLEALKGNK